MKKSNYRRTFEKTFKKQKHLTLESLLILIFLPIISLLASWIFLNKFSFYDRMIIIIYTIFILFLYIIGRYNYERSLK